MKRTLVVIGIVIAAIAAIIIYLYATVPKVVAPVAAPFGNAASALLSHVPAGATDIAYVRRAAAVYGKALGDPIAGPPLRDWSDRAGLTHLPMLLGSADAVAWRTDNGGFGFAARPDLMRRALTRLYLAVSGRDDLSLDGGALLMNAGEAGASPAEAASELESLAAGLPPADLVVLQREGSRGAFPPIGRPAVTAIRLTGRTILLDSQARPESGVDESVAALPFAAPAGAMLSFAMARPPRLAGELNRLFATKVTPLLDHGGMLVVYDVDARSLLPRPTGVVVLEADDAHREALAAFVQSLTTMVGSAASVAKRQIGAVEVETRDAYGMRIETAETPAGELLLSFDRSSIERYLAAPGRGVVDRAPATWTAVVNPSVAAPVIGRLARSPGFRILSPKLYRAAANLETWMTALESASTVEVRKDRAGDQERIRVLIRAK
jgi:hypothetical protein